MPLLLYDLLRVRRESEAYLVTKEIEDPEEILEMRLELYEHQHTLYCKQMGPPCTDCSDSFRVVREGSGEGTK